MLSRVRQRLADPNDKSGERRRVLSNVTGFGEKNGPTLCLSGQMGGAIEPVKFRDSGVYGQRMRILATLSGGVFTKGASSVCQDFFNFA